MDMLQQKLITIVPSPLCAYSKDIIKAGLYETCVVMTTSGKLPENLEVGRHRVIYHSFWQ